jgi:hypothetical protein
MIKVYRCGLAKMPWLTRLPTDFEVTAERRKKIARELSDLQASERAKDRASLS